MIMSGEIVGGLVAGAMKVRVRLALSRGSVLGDGASETTASSSLSWTCSPDFLL